MRNRNIERIIDTIDRLPVLPVIYTRLRNLLDKPHSTVNMIANVISEDQTTAAKVLKLVNSAFYGFPKKIADLQRAVVILGLKEINNMVLAAAMLEVFGHLTDGALNMKRFWEHAVGCAVSARVLAEDAHLKSPEEVFTGGLLHDIGKLIHALYLPQEFSRVIADINDTGIPMAEAETKALGFTHALTGRMLAEKWNFPEVIINMIELHHVEDAPSRVTPEVAAVHLGNILCIAFELGSGGEKRVPAVNQRAWDMLGLKISDLESICGRINKLFGEATVILE